MLLILVRSGDSSASEQWSAAATAARPDSGFGQITGQETTPLVLPMFDLPKAYRPMGLPEDPQYPAHDFRPRGHSILDREPDFAMPEEAPMLRGTTVWQRLADYRAHGRVRLLTLWEAGGSTVSLQAGRKGEPSLQWTSRAMNRGGATRGLLDRLVSVSMAGANRSLHPAARPATVEPTAHPAKSADSGAGSIK